MAMKNAKLKHEKKIYIFVLFIPHRCVREEREKKRALTWNYLK